MRDKILYILGAVALILLARDIYLFTGFPEDRNQGMIFKIIFFHVPLAITALTCAMVAFLASILFLITKKFQYDALAVAVTEVGLAFLAGNRITGSIWGRVEEKLCLKWSPQQISRWLRRPYPRDLLGRPLKAEL